MLQKVWSYCWQLQLKHYTRSIGWQNLYSTSLASRSAVPLGSAYCDQLSSTEFNIQLSWTNTESAVPLSSAYCAQRSQTNRAEWSLCSTETYCRRCFQTLSPQMWNPAHFIRFSESKDAERSQHFWPIMISSLRSEISPNLGCDTWIKVSSNLLIPNRAKVDHTFLLLFVSGWIATWICPGVLRSGCRGEHRVKVRWECIIGGQPVMLHLATGGMCRYEKFSLPQSLLSAEVAGLNLEEVIGKPDTQEKCRRHDQASCTVTHTHKQKHTHTETHRHTYNVCRT